MYHFMLKSLGTSYLNIFKEISILSTVTGLLINIDVLIMILKSLSTRLQVNKADQGVHLLLGSLALVGLFEQTLLDHLVHLEKRSN